MVPGAGAQPALGMVVGEAPGHKEVELGVPFVGKSGRLLDMALKSFGIARESVFITNVVKELPLDSEGRIRRPYDAEVKAWLPWLEKEIEFTAPQAILALGRIASKALTGIPDLPFGSKIGNVHSAWHPAYLLRGGAGEDGRTLWLEQIESWAEALHG